MKLGARTAATNGAQYVAFDQIDDIPELRDLDLPPRPDGPGVAAMLSAGIGILVLGIVTVMAEASEAFKTWLEETFDFGVGVGPLAGKTILASLAFFVSWAVLGSLLRGKDVHLKRWFTIGFGLGVLGAILLFPPIFLAFEA